MEEPPVAPPHPASAHTAARIAMLNTKRRITLPPSSFVEVKRVGFQTNKTQARIQRGTICEFDKHRQSFLNFSLAEPNLT
jgi:hypothetical protein